jgi:outer membrane protein
MSRSLGLGLCFAYSALFCSAVLAQTAAPAPAKVAVINLQRAVLESAEIKAASTALEAKYKPRQSEMEAIQKELQGIQQQLQSNAQKLTPEAAADLQSRAARRQRELQRIGEDLQADVDRERNEILTGASRRMQEVIKTLAEARGFDLVTDVSNTLYFKPALEITSEAIVAYDKAHPAK